MFAYNLARLEADSGSDNPAPVTKKCTLCKYSEAHNGEVMLVKIREFNTEQRALEFAEALSKYNNDRIVMLTELVIPTSHWG